MYFVEYGALQEKTQTGPVRVIECDTSSLDAVKIPEEFAREIAKALNSRARLLSIAQAVAMLGGRPLPMDIVDEAQDVLLQDK